MAEHGPAHLYALLGHLPGAKRQGSGWQAHCPGTTHRRGDKQSSLSLAVGRDGRVLLNCHAGCETGEILQALGLSWDALFERGRSGGRVWRYQLPTPGPVHHCREDRPDGSKHVWWEHAGKPGLNGTPLASLPLWRSEDLAEAHPSYPVVLTEGERAADAAAALGFVAVGTVTGAAVTPSREALSVLAGREVWLWPDNDEPGQRHMQAIAERLPDSVVRWVDWRDAPEHGDAADYLAAGLPEGGVVALLRPLPSAVEPEPEETVPPFPLEALPPVLRRYVEESATALVAPPDLVAVPLLTLAGAVVGNARELEIKRGWREGPNLYTAVITPPGGKKTPSGAAAKRPIYRVQNRLKQDHEGQLLRHTDEVAEWEALSKVGRAGHKPPEPPKFKHVVTTDATTEAIASMLQHCKGLVLERDELSGWTRSMDQYRGGKGADRQHFLSMWSRGALKVDRKGAPPIFVPHPCLSVTGGIQPDMLAELIDSSGREDGFIDRILLSYPEDMPDCWTEQEVSFSALVAVEELFETLYGLEAVEGSDQGVVRLADGARSLWRDWYEQNAAEQRAPDFPQHLRGAWAKMPSQLLRVTLILHVATYPEALQLTRETLDDGIRVIGYFKAHARRVYAGLQPMVRDMGSRLIDGAIERGGTISAEAARSEVFQRNYSATRVRQEFDKLVAAGRMTYAKMTGTGGRPREEWTVVE